MFAGWTWRVLGLVLGRQEIAGARMRLDDKSVSTPNRIVPLPALVGSGCLFLIPTAQTSIAAYNTSPGQACLDLA